MNKQQLANKIWASANKMRSNKIEVQDYKDYILGFIFYKYLSDTEVKKLRELGMSDEDIKSQLNPTSKEIVKYCKNNFGYFISYENLFSTWLDKKSDFTVKNVSTALSAFGRNINNTYKSVFQNVFRTLETGLSKLGESTGTQTKAISELIHLIKDIPTDDRQGYDVLGFIYEYLISNFAASAGKKAGEFYTPHEVAVLMSEIVADHLKDRDHINIYDPTSGSGSLLLTIGRAVSKYLKGKNKVSYYAQELKEATYNLTRMNLVMRGIEPDDIITRNADTLGQDWPMINENGNYNLLRVDAVVSNPPYSQGWDVKPGDPRFKMGLAPKAKADYAFLLHSLYHLKPDGIMTIVLPTGVLYRDEEHTIRKNLIDRGHIETIIALPQNIFFGTSIPTIIMVLRQKREADDVLFVDATQCSHKVGKKNVLRSSDIRRIADAVRDRVSKPHFCELVGKKVISEKNDYNLYIPRYVDSADSVEVEDLYAHIFGGVPNEELHAFDDYWSEFKCLRNEIFTSDDTPYSTVKSPDITATIAKNPNVIDFTIRYHSAFDDFGFLLKRRLIDGMKTVDAPNELMSLSGILFSRVETFEPLVDKYNVYQILDNHWTDIATDIEIIQTEGFDATRKVDADMEVKTKKDGTEDEVFKGWKGRIMPFSLIQTTLLKEEKSMLDECAVQLNQTVAEYDVIMSDLSDDERENWLNEQGDSLDWTKIRENWKSVFSAIRTPEIIELEDYLIVFAKKNKPETLAFVKNTHYVDWAALTPARDGLYSKISVESRIFVLRRNYSFDEDSSEGKLCKLIALSDKELMLKHEIKERKFALENLTKTTIESLTDEQVLDLLQQKWIAPLCDELLSVPAGIIQNFTNRLIALTAKYEDTLHSINTQISEAEASLSEMLADLRGNEFDMAAIRELQQMMQGHVGSDCVEALHTLCISKMFANKEEREPKIRFRQYNDAWTTSTLGDLSDKVTEKNSTNAYNITLTNSAEHGIINQMDFFNHAISNASTLNGYYVVRNNDFVYNPRISVTAPYGPINRNSLGYTGVMSPLYYVFRTHDIDTEYLSHFFKTSIWHKFMQFNGNSGARYDRFSIKNAVFELMPISYPSSLEEQKIVGRFFTILNRLIILRTQQLAKLKSLKNSCLQKMFV